MNGLGEALKERLFLPRGGAERGEFFPRDMHILGPRLREPSGALVSHPVAVAAEGLAESHTPRVGSVEPRDTHQGRPVRCC